MKKLKRSDIIKAIKTERLKGGAYFDMSSIKPDPLTCAVCAVGAIMRQKFKAKVKKAGLYVGALGFHLTRGLSSYYHPITKALEDNNYLGALSIRFEQLSHQEEYLNVNRTLNAAGKKVLIKFVELNIPAIIEVDL